MSIGDRLAAELTIRQFAELIIMAGMASDPNASNREIIEGATDLVSDWLGVEDICDERVEAPTP